MELLRKLVRADTCLSWCGFHILPAYGFCYILRRHAVCCKPVRVQPYTHCVVAASHYLDEAYAVDTFEFSQDIDVCEIVDEFFGMRAVCTEYVQVHEHTVHFLFRDDTGPDYFLGKFVKYGRYPVLYVHGGYVRVCPYLEVNGSERHAVVGTDGGHIGHPRHSVYRTLQRRGHSLRHYVCTCTRIACSDRDRRRDNVWKLRDRQGVKRNQSQACYKH